MIGFDIDGVFIGDKNQSAPLDEYLKTRGYFSPLFIPEGKYVLVTGRPSIDKDDTLAWVRESFAINPPQEIYHENKDMMLAKEYKVSAILKSKVDIFIESDKEQVDYFKRVLYNTNIKIVHFSDFILDKLRGV